MPEATPLQYGAHPGLRFACALDGRGGCRDLGWSDVEAWRTDAGVLWIHIERDDPRAQAWMREQSGIDPLIVESLLAEESRPRVERVGDGLLVVLRGVNRREGEDPIDLVPLHVWGDADRVISLRDKDHYLMALRDIRETLTEGRGVLTAGQLFALIADKVVKYVEPLIEELEDQVDAEALPGQLPGVALRQHLDGAHADIDAVGLDLDRAGERAMHRIVFQEVRVVLGRDQVVDGHDLEVAAPGLDKSAQHVATDAAEAGDCDADGH